MSDGWLVVRHMQAEMFWEGRCRGHGYLLIAVRFRPTIRLAAPTTATNFGGTLDDACFAVAINAEGTELYVGGKYGRGVGGVEKYGPHGQSGSDH